MESADDRFVPSTACCCTYGAQSPNVLVSAIPLPDDVCAFRALPSSLLLLSRAFTVTQPLEAPTPDAPYDSLKETISALPSKARRPSQPILHASPGVGPLCMACCHYPHRMLLAIPCLAPAACRCCHGCRHW